MSYSYGYTEISAGHIIKDHGTLDVLNQLNKCCKIVRKLAFTTPVPSPITAFKPYNGAFDMEEKSQVWQVAVVK